MPPLQPQLPILRVKTPRFTHNALAFSPFFDDQIAVASGTNFGLIGNGRVNILKFGQGGLRVVKTWVHQKYVAQVDLLTPGLTRKIVFTMSPGTRPTSGWSSMLHGQNSS